ncbi:MAG TPA: BadF/BadG/BcrA/BcrD ATPase family protein [Micromonosporaceae bacterium]|nr:BadF/BadG/BcrA/BcrD ATPase family protein [Micromonosporaceae bacterium]
MSETLVVGLDVGGTATRATVATAGGEVLGSGRAGGGNPTSHGAEAAAMQLRAALADALAAVDPSRVRAGIIGLAGAARLVADPAGRAAFDRAWEAVGLRCPYALVGDALVAYASATAALNGTVLIAGTGAIAAEIRGLILGRIADGHGWLLGDAGSGFWLGREAVRSTLAELDAHRDPSQLAQLVLKELLGSPQPAASPRQTVDALVQAVTRRPPVELAALAPLVIQAHAADDQTAQSIVAAAADQLAQSVARIRPPEAASPIVLAGGLLTANTPLATAVQGLLHARWPSAPRLTAGDGAVGAAWLAARALPEVTDPKRLHARLLGRARP